MWTRGRILAAAALALCAGACALTAARLPREKTQRDVIVDWVYYSDAGELAQQAAYILHGAVRERGRSYPVPGEDGRGEPATTWMYTAKTLEVFEAIKDGGTPAGAAFTLFDHGGESPTERWNIGPVLEIGEEVVVCLDERRAVMGAFGVYRVEDGKVRVEPAFIRTYLPEGESLPEEPSARIDVAVFVQAMRTAARAPGAPG